MVIIAEANMLCLLEETDKKALNALTGSDKIIVLCDKKSTVSVETMQLFLGLKAKSEFVQVEDLKAQFSLGYRYGEFACKYAKDKVKILTNNDYSAVLSSNMICVKSLANASSAGRKKQAPTKLVNDEKPQKLVKKIEKIVEPEEKEEKPVVSTAAEPKRRGKLKDLSADSIISTYPALLPYKTKLTSLSGMFFQAIKAATNAEDSLKLQLKMGFGEDGEQIWKVIKKDYNKLKTLV